MMKEKKILLGKMIDNIWLGLILPIVGMLLYLCLLLVYDTNRMDMALFILFTFTALISAWRWKIGNPLVFQDDMLHFSGFSQKFSLPLQQVESLRERPVTLMRFVGATRLEVGMTAGAKKLLWIPGCRPEDWERMIAFLKENFSAKA